MVSDSSPVDLAPFPLGIYALRMGLLTDEMLDECLQAEARSGGRKKLLEILLDRKLLTPSQARTLLRTNAEGARGGAENAETAQAPSPASGAVATESAPQSVAKIGSPASATSAGPPSAVSAVPGSASPASSAIPDDSFGRLAVRAGIISVEQLQDALVAQRFLAKKGRPMRLGGVLVSQGHMTSHQVRIVMSLQDKELYRCAGCGARCNVSNPEPGRAIPCRHCGGDLTPATEDGELDAGGSWVMLRPVRAEAETASAEIARGADPVPERGGGSAAPAHGTGQGTAETSSPDPFVPAARPAAPTVGQSRPAGRKIPQPSPGNRPAPPPAEGRVYREYGKSRPSDSSAAPWLWAVAAAAVLVVGGVGYFGFGGDGSEVGPVSAGAGAPATSAESARGAGRPRGSTVPAVGASPLTADGSPSSGETAVGSHPPASLDAAPSSEPPPPEPKAPMIVPADPATYRAAEPSAASPDAFGADTSWIERALQDLPPEPSPAPSALAPKGAAGSPSGVSVIRVVAGIRDAPGGRGGNLVVGGEVLGDPSEGSRGGLPEGTPLRVHVRWGDGPDADDMWSGRAEVRRGRFAAVVPGDLLPPAGGECRILVRVDDGLFRAGVSPAVAPTWRGVVGETRVTIEPSERVYVGMKELARTVLAAASDLRLIHVEMYGYLARALEKSLPKEEWVRWKEDRRVERHRTRFGLDDHDAGVLSLVPRTVQEAGAVSAQVGTVCGGVDQLLAAEPDDETRAGLRSFLAGRKSAAGAAGSLERLVLQEGIAVHARRLNRLFMEKRAENAGEWRSPGDEPAQASAGRSGRLDAISGQLGEYLDLSWTVDRTELRAEIDKTVRDVRAYLALGAPPASGEAPERAAERRSLEERIGRAISGLEGGVRSGPGGLPPSSSRSPVGANAPPEAPAGPN